MERAGRRPAVGRTVKVREGFLRIKIYSIGIFEYKNIRKSRGIEYKIIRKKISIAYKNIRKTDFLSIKIYAKPYMYYFYTKYI